MIKTFKMKLLMTFIIVVIVGNVSTKILPMFHNEHSAIKKPQVSNIKGVTVDFKNAHKKDVLKASNLLSDEKNSNDNSQDNNENTNKYESISSKLEKSNNANDINIQIDASSKLEKSDNTNDINMQATTNVQLKDANSNTNTNSQDSTNDTLEVEIPTIHYDRTTSIYANDNITLLRIEYYINNKLTYYSVIEQFDAATKSYIEKIYQCNRETNIDPLIRTDIYINGNLVKTY